jgi:hypothetical protein
MPLVRIQCWTVYRCPCPNLKHLAWLFCGLLHVCYAFCSSAQDCPPFEKSRSLTFEFAENDVQCDWSTDAADHVDERRKQSRIKRARALARQRAVDRAVRGCGRWHLPVLGREHRRPSRLSHAATVITDCRWGSYLYYSFASSLAQCSIGTRIS